MYSGIFQSVIMLILIQGTKI